MKRTHTFEAHDGTRFHSAAECKSYEGQETLVLALSGLMRSHILAAFCRADLATADAFERAGAIVAKRRRADGDMKRVRNAKQPGGALAPAIETQMESIKKNMMDIS